MVPGVKKVPGVGSGGNADLRNQEFGKRLKKKRLEIGITKKDLCEKIGANKNAIGIYENGQYPRADFAVKLAKVFGCSVDWLLTGEGDHTAGNNSPGGGVDGGPAAEYLPVKNSYERDPARSYTISDTIARCVRILEESPELRQSLTLVVDALYERIDKRSRAEDRRSACLGG